MLEAVLKAGPDADVKGLAACMRAVADATRAGVTLRDERRRALAAASDAAIDAARAEGLSQDTVAAIRAAIEGAQ